MELGDSSWRHLGLRGLRTLQRLALPTDEKSMLPGGSPHPTALAYWSPGWCYNEEGGRSAGAGKSG